MLNAPKSVPSHRSVVTSIADAVLTSLDTREVLLTATELVGQAFRVSRCLAATYSPKFPTTCAPVEWSIGLPEPDLDAYSVMLASSLQAIAAESRTPTVVDDVRSDERLIDFEAELEKLDVRSLIAVPTRFRGVANGSILLYQSGQPRRWKDWEVQALEEIAYFVGVALWHTSRVGPEAARGTEPQQFLNSSVAETIFDENGVVESVSPAITRITGYGREQFVGNHFETFLEKIVYPADQPKVVKHYRNVIEQDRPVAPIRYRIDRADGERAWVMDQLSSRSSGEESGRSPWLVSSMFDTSAWQGEIENVRASEERYRRLVENSDAIIFHTDPSHTISFISRRAMDFFGVAPEDFVARRSMSWLELVHPDDRERVENLLGEMQLAGSSFDEEFRVINRVTGQVRWLLTRLMPIRGSRGEIIGWDGFGIDITGRREAQDALVVQSKKVRALYTVSSAIRGFLDPVHIASRGLHALCDATGADAGLCYMFSPLGSNNLRMVTNFGFPEELSSRFNDITNLPNLSSYVAKHGQPIVVPDIRNDPRASVVLAEQGIRSAVLVPVTVEDEVLGTLALFSRSVARFDGGDVMLVSAASNQIGLAARQAELFASHKRQARNLSALYRASHELSRNVSLDDIFLQAFTIIRDELGLKRLWLGLLNELGTRLVGQAAYGPGLKRKLVEINMDISGAENPIAAVVQSQSPQVVSAEQVSMLEGLHRIFSRLDIDEVVLVPLVSGGQTLGVLAVQPSEEDRALSEEDIALLRSLAAEIAAVLFAKRLEERIAEGDKMRTAGLLAAGIAHNFNNLLQAILGQASLLEIQGHSPEKIQRASRLIHDAATKGAGLVRQLMSFAQLEQPRREPCDCNYLVENAVRSAREVSGSGADVQLSLGGDVPRAFVDPGQLRQVLSNLLLNAFDAVSEDSHIEVETERVFVDDRSPLYEVPYGEYIRISVRDHGRGMDEDTRKRCLEPFFTTKNVDPVSGIGMSGTGLGMAAAYALTRRNGGNMVVESRPGQGTVVTMYLPSEEQADRANSSELRDEEPQPRTGDLRVVRNELPEADEENEAEKTQPEPISLAEHLRKKRGKGTARVLPKTERNKP